MKLEKQTYFQLLEDAIVYKAHKDEIDKTVEAEEADRSLGRSEEYRHLDSPEEIEIPDAEYEELKKRSELLDKYEGGWDKLLFSFESYRKKYEKEVQKNYKMRRIVEGLMDHYVDDMSDKLRVLLDILL